MSREKILTPSKNSNISALRDAREALHQSVAELEDTYATLKNLIKISTDDQQERERLAKSGTFIL